MATAVSGLIGSVLMFVEFGVLACSAAGSRGRSRFYVRLSCASLVMLAAALGLALAINSSALPQRAGGLPWVALLLAALAVAPVFCYHTFAAFHGSSEGDGGGGPGFRSADGSTSRRRSAPGCRPRAVAQARSQPAEPARRPPPAAGCRAGAAGAGRPRPPIADSSRLWKH